MGLRQRNKKASNLERLLSDELQSFYWMGFLAADGCFYKNQIIINLSSKDRNHLVEFAQYIGKGEQSIQDKIIRYDSNLFGEKFKNRMGFASRVSFSSVYYVPLIREKFDMKSRKTYNPPSIKIFDKMSNSQFLSWAIGFIDGDGSIVSNILNKKWLSLKIKIHENWKENLIYIRDRLFTSLNLQPPKKVTKVVNIDSTLCNLQLSNTFLLSQMKKFILDSKLYVLNRKWDKVNFDYTNRFQKTKEDRELIFPLWEQGLTSVEIGKKLNIHRTTVHSIIKRSGRLPNLSRKSYSLV